MLSPEAMLSCPAQASSVISTHFLSHSPLKPVQLPVQSPVNRVQGLHIRAGSLILYRQAEGIMCLPYKNFESKASHIIGSRRQSLDTTTKKMKTRDRVGLDPGIEGSGKRYSQC